MRYIVRVLHYNAIIMPGMMKHAPALVNEQAGNRLHHSIVMVFNGHFDSEAELTLVKGGCTKRKEHC